MCVPSAPPEESVPSSSQPQQLDASTRPPPPMETKNSDPPQKQFLLDSSVYRSSLVYRPNDYYNATHKGKYDQDEDDLEAQDDQKAMLGELGSEKKQRRRRSCAFCCCTICNLVLILLLAAAIVFIKLIPKDPAVSLGALKIDQLVYNESSSGVQTIQASLTLGLNVTNRNPHADAIYRGISLGLFFHGESLGSFNISPEPHFEQKRKSTTSIVADLPSTTTTIVNKANANSLQNQMANSNVQLDLTGSISGIFKVLGMKVRKFDIGINCQLNVDPGSGGSRAATQIGLTCY